MSKTVLVTGANGFIGTEVVRKLEVGGWNVLSAVREPKLANEVKFDLTDLDFVDSLKCIKKPEAIIHLAASVDFTTNTLSDIYIQNVAATSTLLTLAKNWNARFIFASTILVSENTSMSEDSTDTPYAKSKYLSELLINASGIKSTILRIAGVYGLNGPSHLSLNRAIMAVRNGEAPVQIGKGLAKRNYLYVKDVATIIVNALENDVTGTHLIAGKETLSIAQMLLSLCDAFIPDKTPIVIDGQEAIDQVIKSSPSLPAIFSFNEAVKDMFLEANK